MQRLVNVPGQVQHPAQGHRAPSRFGSRVGQQTHVVIQRHDYIVHGGLAANRLAGRTCNIGKGIDADINIALHRGRSAQPGAVDVMPVAAMISSPFGPRQPAGDIRPERRLAEQPGIEFQFVAGIDEVRNLFHEVFGESRMRSQDSHEPFADFGFEIFHRNRSADAMADRIPGQGRNSDGNGNGDQ